MSSILAVCFGPMPRRACSALRRSTRAYGALFVMVRTTYNYTKRVHFGGVFFCHFYIVSFIYNYTKMVHFGGCLFWHVRSHDMSCVFKCV